MLFFFYFFSCFPVSRFLSYAWNLGSFLGLLYLVQFVSGFFLAFSYTSDSFLSFDSVQYICREVNFGWLVRIIHFNGASFIFFVLYFHICKGFFFFGFRLLGVWVSGFFLLVFFMGTAFTGYVLVWSQMSYWAAVVITSLLSVLPFFGSGVLHWVWGGYSVGSATLKFFFVVHYFLPFLIMLILFVHLFSLHESGSTSFLGYSGVCFKFSFFPYYLVKDLMNFFFLWIFFLFLLLSPYYLGDPEMFELANPLVSPVHIVPEWYFLAYYAILRSIPSKGVGVSFMFFSLLFLLFFSYMYSYYPPLMILLRFFVFFIIFNFIFLSWVGQCPLESPFLFLGQVSLFLYFFLFFFFLFSFFVSSFIYSIF